MLFWFLVWHIISVFVDQEILLVSPVEVIERIGEMAVTAEFWKITSMSLLRIFMGLFLGIIAGVVFAAATHHSNFLYNLLYPLLSAVKATPVTSFILLAFVWIQSPYIPVFISFLMVLPVVWGNVLEGIRNTDTGLLEMAKVMGLGKKKTLFKIYVPSVKPYFVAACATVTGLAWKAGIAAEVITHPVFAIGTKMYYSKIYLETRDLLAWTLLVIVISVLFEKVFLGIIKRDRRGERSGGQNKKSV